MLFVPESKDSTKSLPKLHKILFFSPSQLPTPFFFLLFTCFSGPHRLTVSSCVHSPDTYPSAVRFQLCRPDRKWSFGLGSDVAVIRTMEIPSVKINNIVSAFSILGYPSHQSTSSVLSVLPPCLAVRKRGGVIFQLR